ncbi:MAG: hypothetical protein ACYC5O_17510 [Anaerolineae bacterium]
MKGPKAPYILALVSVLATLWVTFALTSEFFGILENSVGLVIGLILGLAIAQTYLVPKQKMQWERIRLKRKYGNTRQYREFAPPDEEERVGGWSGFFSGRTWGLVNIVLGFGLLLMLFALGAANILTAAMGIVTMINIRLVMVNYQAIKHIEADDRERQASG